MAYAVVTSLMRTIHQSMELTGCDLQPFYEKLESLRAILEKSCNVTGDHEELTILEVEIVEVAYTTEDMVDSESRSVFLAQNLEERSRAMWEIFFVLEQALECIDSTVKQYWMATSDSMKDLKPQTCSLVSLPEHAVEQPENIMVGRENEFEMMLDQLVRGGRELEVVSIVGMGGIGKTTLAAKLYSDPCIMSRFDIRAKVTVSQEYCVRNVILGLLSSISDEPDDQLADRLQKHLKGRRYLVVIDDIWTTEAWDDIKLCFPDCYNGSRILLTTRNVEVAEYASSEGFLNEEEGKSIEEVAETCINELVDRSLISIHNLSFDWEIQRCGMHDVTRELCLREAQNMNFVNVIRGKSDQNSCAQSMQCSFKSRSRISIYKEEELAWCRNSEAHSIIMLGRFKCVTLELSFKLYRGSKEAVPSSIIDIPVSISSLCYLQTFKLYLPFNNVHPFILPSEILTMPQLRKLCMGWNYLRSHEPTENRLKLKVYGVPEDFRNLKDLYDFRYLYQLEKLEFGISYPFVACFLKNTAPSGSTQQDPLRFQMETLHLETHFRATAPPTDVPTLLLPPPDCFPQNLKSLTFSGDFLLAWKDLSIVGKLPKLEVLKLSYNAFIGEEWEVVEEGFPHLKFLFLDNLYIQYWRASSDHFPYLERLFLRNCYNLDSIPRDFADITTLALIDITGCQQSVGNSAKQIQQDIQDNYGSSIEVHTRDLFIFDSVTTDEDDDDDFEKEVASCRNNVE
ncbi:hypothetical protein KY290_012379 [Solanum tuberosum]|uniref:NB-ARC domain-containing protein n=1 Tax=Solanum tuberosum TaxID=4113 RepID=A0ABQ7W3E7_SOLTU|nr:hypothetical protein KY290_012379 [Solanum tuberosum]